MKNPIKVIFQDGQVTYEDGKIKEILSSGELVIRMKNITLLIKDDNFLVVEKNER